MHTLKNIVIERGISCRLSDILAEAELPQHAWLITDSTVMRIHGRRVVRALAANGIDVHIHTVPPGEGSKSVTRAAELWQWLASEGAERSHPVIALGGGVVGDLVGFVAATYLRGVPLIHVPTTLLAQIDSSIGGKVAVDLAEGKNLVGAFYPAIRTVIDPDLLESLPRAQLIADYAEVIKTAIIFDEQMFSLIEANVDNPDHPNLLSTLVDRCVHWKATIVDQDPEDRGPRAVLNYGHTIAHAIEAVGQYSEHRHGEAVAIGMAGAAAIGTRIGVFDAVNADRQTALLTRMGLPQTYTCARPEDLITAMQRDKKVRDGRIQWVLADRIGAASPGHHVDAEVVLEVLSEIRRNSA